MLGSDESILVIGGGAAAHSCITTYRDAGGDRPVLMVSSDDRLPYFRPAVSKEYLLGQQTPEDMRLADEQWFSDHDVAVVLGCDVTSVDVERRTADSSRGPLTWSRCVVATGSDPSQLPVPGADDERVQTIRSATDTERLLELVGAGGSIVIIGSGFIGCEVAAGLRSRGVAVTMVSQEAAPQQDRLGRVVGELIGGHLRDLGVELALGTPVEAIHHGPGRARVEVADGSMHEADHVLVAAGARPRAQLLEPLGLVTDGAVHVASTMATAIDGVFAVGDIAAAWNESASRRLRVEHWGDAEGHGQVLGGRLAGEDRRWSDVPGFWSTIVGVTLKYVAWGDGHDTMHVDRSGSGLTVRYGRDDVVVGVLTHEHDEDIETAEQAITARRPMP